MRSRAISYGALSAWLFLFGWTEAGGHGGHPSHAKGRRHQHQHRAAPPVSMVERGIKAIDEQISPLQRREKQCQFPTDAGLISVTPDAMNAGWAMSPDQPCKPDSYCPYACPPGQLMAQWDPTATTYTYPQSQVGPLCSSAQLPIGPKHVLIYPRNRTVGYTATQTARSRSLSRRNHIAWTDQGRSDAGTRLRRTSPFVRRSCRGTRPC